MQGPVVFIYQWSDSQQLQWENFSLGSRIFISLISLLVQKESNQYEYTDTFNTDSLKAPY